MEDYAKGELHYLNRHAGQENLNIIQLLQDIHGTNTLLEITQESLNFQAPLNEAEGEIAKEQKQLIQRLIAKNWTPNQIIYEIERIYGMDAFIKSRPIIDNRSWPQRIFTPTNIGIGMCVVSFVRFRYRSMRKF